MSKTVTSKLDVVMDDGTEYEVLADQRDFASWEAADIEGGGHTMIRYYAWNAMKRNGQYSGSFEKFNSKECMQVGIRAEEKPTEQEAGDSLDPTKKNSSSSTPGRRSR